MPAQATNDSQSESVKIIRPSESCDGKPTQGGGQLGLKTCGDIIVHASNSTLVAAIESDASQKAFAALKESIGTFAQNSRIIMHAMDELAKVHPFVQVAVSLFKAGITLKLNRRENDDKVIALNVKMCEMMMTLEHLYRTADLEGEEHGTMLESMKKSVKDRMGAIEATIEECASLCDSYQKCHIVVRFFMSSQWKIKFTEVAQKFADHAEGIKYDLHLRMSVDVAQTRIKLDSVSRKVDVVVFRTSGIPD